jgi:hypothetical protein
MNINNAIKSYGQIWTNTMATPPFGGSKDKKRFAPIKIISASALGHVRSGSKPEILDASKCFPLFTQ